MSLMGYMGITGLGLEEEYVSDGLLPCAICGSCFPVCCIVSTSFKIRLIRYIFARADVRIHLLTH